VTSGVRSVKGDGAPHRSSLLPLFDGIHRLRAQRSETGRASRFTAPVLFLPDDAYLRPAERFALDLLVDLSAVVRFGGTADVVRLHVTGADEVRTYAHLRARQWGISAADGRVTVERALLRFIIDVAGASAEQGIVRGDRYDRVPASDTPPVRDGFYREAVVSLAGRALAKAVRQAAGRRPARFIDPWPNGRRWAAALSHDLDVVEWWPAFTALRLAELARHAELRRAASVAASAIRSVGRSVVWSAIETLLATEARYNVRSSWFVLCGTPTIGTAAAGDLTYRPESPLARRILRAVAAAGHEIGLHGSFATAVNHSQFMLQRARLAAIVGDAPSGVRQHYLRLRPSTTPNGMADAGFSYDSTYGYADRNGFRLGVADVVPLWNAAAQKPVGLDEVPFIWMDRALSKYQHVEEPNAWIDDALALAESCREVEGLWVGIWHPNLVPALGFPNAPAAYERLMAGLREREPYVAPIGELLAWRRARRSIRATAIAPSGTVLYAKQTREPGAPAPRIRDADGHSDPMTSVD
jgi:peptidoglycan/xylan/chitin deacetylase (PgdA/CDA1 family)